MSEEKAKKEVKKPDAAAAVPGPATYGAKKTKQAWTLERCKKFARRYMNEKEWQVGSPSSYKAATAHGWMAECKPLFKKADGGKKLRKSA